MFLDTQISMVCPYAWHLSLFSVQMKLRINAYGGKYFSPDTAELWGNGHRFHRSHKTDGFKDEDWGCSSVGKNSFCARLRFWVQTLAPM